MTWRAQIRRVLLLALLLAIAFAGLAYRLVDLQVLRHDDLLAKAQLNTQVEYVREPLRGDILDVKGNLLAHSVFVKTICADPVLVGLHQAEVAKALAGPLQMNEGELYQRLLPHVYQNAQGNVVTQRYVVLKRKVKPEEWQQIQGVMDKVKLAGEDQPMSRTEAAALRALRSKAVFADPRDDQIRDYPNRALASHVLGFVGVEERDFNGRRISETAGKEGIEFSLNSKLAGVRGFRVTEADKERRELVSLRDEDIEPRDGMNVFLTLDSNIQQITQAAIQEAMVKHNPVSVSAIVMRPRTGEILAMATIPDFDPNNLAASTSEGRKNRVIGDVMEPGSTFKITVVSGALNDRLVTLADQFDCEHGQFSYGGKVLHDHKAYDLLSVEQIITKSSNIGAAKIGIRLGANRLYDYMRAFGFGEKTGLPLPGEVRGIVSSPTNWFKVSLAQIPMGHGIAVTRLQMISAMCALANNGTMMRPMIIDRLEDRDGKVVAKYEPQTVRQVVTPATAKLMVQALKTVVTSDGTAAEAKMDHYTVAGKTGTAQKAVGGTYSTTKFISSFIGFFPADRPELCISVVLDEPQGGHYGGEVAAPVFKQIAERTANYLNIRPDVEAVSTTVATENKTTKPLISRQ